MLLKKSDSLDGAAEYFLYLNSDVLSEESSEGFMYSISGLPEWLSYDSSSKSFTGIVPENCERIFEITVEGSNECGAVVSEACVLHVVRLDTLPVVILLHMYLEAWISRLVVKLKKKFKPSLSNFKNNLVR